MKKWMLFVGVFVVLIGSARSTDLKDRDEKVENEDLAFHLLDNRKVVEPGGFRVWVAADRDSGTPVKLMVQD